MAISKRTVLLSAALMVTTTDLAYAQGQSQSHSKSQQSQGNNGAADAKRNVRLAILGTLSNRANDTLTIRGMGFGDRAAQVWCQDYPLTVMSWTDEEIVANLPDALPDGSYLLTVIRGEGQKDRDVFDMAVQGQTTVSGTPGPKGDAGPVGPAGAKGEPGSVGPAGPKGDTGAAGVAGPKGDAGAVGPAGPKGDAGVAGATGPKGDTGAMGPAGAKGEIGATGPAGAKGEIGATGPAGATGDTGAIGPIGPKGDIGPAGAEGSGRAGWRCGTQGRHWTDRSEG